jgi:hypothetical protein
MMDTVAYWDGHGVFRQVFAGTAVPFTIVADERGFVRHASIGQQPRQVPGAIGPSGFCVTELPRMAFCVVDSEGETVRGTPSRS